MLRNKKIIFTIPLLASFFLIVAALYTITLATVVTLATSLLIGLFFKLNNSITDDTRLTDFFIDTRRNFDFLLLGSTVFWKAIDENKFNRNGVNKIKSYAFYQRSLYADFFILQRMFSYLRNEGTVIITLDLDDPKQYATEKLTYADYRILHPLTRENLRFSISSLQSNYPLLFFPAFSIGYLTAKIQRKLFVHRNLKNISPGITRTPDNIITLTHEKLITRINQMIQFCSERNLNTSIACVARTPEAIHIFRELSDRLKALHPGVNVSLVNRYSDFNRLVNPAPVKKTEAKKTHYRKVLLNFCLLAGYEFLPAALAI
ncbi:MAG: hypothetical protein JW761_10715 [Prolixibacteraceae bacterium]|nr:hypothetical protein [Prolixibacteraceae bacterium]